MAEIPSDQSPTLSPPLPGSDSDSSQYWCYNCEKRVTVETPADLAEIVCFECKNGFVEVISATTGTGAGAEEETDDPALDTEFLQILRLIARHVRDEHVREQGPVPAPNSDPTDEDYLRVELNGWDDGGEEEEEDEVEEEDEHSVEVVTEEDGDNREHLSDESRSDGEEEEEEEEENDVIEQRDEVEDQSERIRRLGLRYVEFAAQAANRVDRSNDGEVEENEVIEPAEEDEREPIRRRRVFRLRDRDFTTQSDSRRNRILDWAEILMGLEDHSIELRMHVGDSDTYVGNPGDYVDAAQYETLLQNLADSGERRGAPPASKAAVEALESVVIEKEEDVMGCAICKDCVNVGEVAKNMPCGHGYHGECIVPWLDSRNSCPVCRFELPTDDPEYEEDRKKRGVVAGMRVESTSSSAAAGGDHDDSGLD